MNTKKYIFYINDLFSGFAYITNNDGSATVSVWLSIHSPHNKTIHSEVIKGKQSDMERVRISLSSYQVNLEKPS